MKNNNPQKGIPIGWQEITMDNLCSLITNGFVGTATTHYTNSDEGILYIQGYNVLENGFNFRGIKKVTKDFHNKNLKSQLKKWDLLTIQTGEVGLTTIVPDELVGSNCHALIISRFRQELAFPPYMVQFFNSPIGRYHLKRIETGSTMKHLNVGDLKVLKVTIPALSEQKHIVSVLESWDHAIEKLVKKIKIKKNIKKGLMKNLLTGAVRLAGFKDKWKQFQLSNICEIKKGQELSKEKLNNDGKYKCILYGELYTKYSELINDVISRTNVKEGTFSANGDILIPASTTTSAMDLAIAACLNEEGVLLGGDINILRAKKKYDSRFLALYLTHVKKHNLARLAQGITIVHLYGKDFKKLNIEIPEEKEQSAIADILVTADKEIEALEKKLTVLKDQKKYLLNNLITGTIRTKA